MSVPVHRWFRYSAGFDGSWAESVIASEGTTGSLRVFDPFAGSGTTLIAAEWCGVESSGIDSHPFVARVAQAKLAYRTSPEKYLEAARVALSRAGRERSSVARYSPVIHRCYTTEALHQLDSLRRAVARLPADSDSGRLVWLTLVAILRSTSHVGTANWQYLLPKRRKARVRDPYSAFRSMTETIHQDMLLARRIRGPRATFALDDARLCHKAPSDHFNLVLTSPPYPNNYDYADATRLELMFFGEITRWRDLQPVIRRHLLRSCTQHVPNRAVNLAKVIARPELDPIRPELEEVCGMLAEIRLTRRGRKTYHNMVACYFLDLAQVWTALRRVCTSPSRVCFVIGDSAPYGVYVPVMEWLGALALAAGFRSFSFEKIRERNTKWKNRKHRVPLCEGHLWVEG